MAQDTETRRVDTFGSVKEPEPQELLEAGDYTVELHDVQLVKNKFYNPDDTSSTEWQWQFDAVVAEDGPDDGARLRVWAPERGYISSRSKAGQIIEAFLGRELRPGENLGPDHVLGRKAKFVVKVEKRQDGSTYNKVAGFTALRRRGRKESDREVEDIEL